MFKRLSARLTVLLALIMLPIMDMRALEPVAIGTKHTIQSDVLGEERTYFVALPESYSWSKDYRTYPVIYILDGNWYFAPFATAARQLAADVSPHIPEMIIIGVSNDGQRVRDASPTRSLIGYEGLEDKGYATSGGGDSFLDFLENELIPHIDASYATSDYRLLAGYSFNGLPVLHSLFTRPDIFGAHIAIDPSQWWDDFVIYKRAADTFGTRTFKNKALYLATQSEAYPVRHFPTAADPTNIADILRAINPAGLHWAHKSYSGDNHHTLQLTAFMDGLKHVFAGHKPTLEILYTKPDAISAQYKTLSARLGTTIRPNEGAINFMGHNLMRYLKRPDIEMALVHFRMNADNYPASANAWISLGMGLKAADRRAEAIEAFERAIALKPDNQTARRELEVLSATPEN